MDLNQLKTIDLISFLNRYYSLNVNRRGAALCPFHEDKKPSFSVFKTDGAWFWKCHCCAISGTIIDFVMKKDGFSLPIDAAKHIMELRGSPEDPGHPPKFNPEIVRFHSYTDENGIELWQKVKLADGSFRCRRRVQDGTWIYNLEGVKRVPYRLHAIKNSPYVVICEGEKDADTLAELGYPATSGPSGKDSWPDEITPIFQGKEVRIVFDVGQDNAARALAKKLSPVCSYIHILRVPLQDYEADITDYLSQFRTNDEKRCALWEILKKEERYEPTFSDADAPLSIPLSSVKPKTVPWLWQDFIPLGRATLISGDPGSAKTWFCLDLASRLSRGLPWADESSGISPAQTIYLTVEDDIHDTIRPRVDLLGGDVSMISVYNSDHPLHLNLSSPEGIKRLEDEVTRLGNVRLVVIDPIIDFSGDVNPNATQEVRALLTPLIQLAARYNFALVLVGHLNKAQALSAIYRASGTTSGWLGKCRSAFMVFRDNNDKSLRHIIPIKNNLPSKDLPQLEFRILDCRLDIKISTEEVDPDEQLNPQHGPSPRERNDAVKWLEDLFAGRTEIPATEVEEKARFEVISNSTLKRAKKAAGIMSEKRVDGTGKAAWVWILGASRP